jgi:UDP-glucose 4-epimerase
MKKILVTGATGFIGSRLIKLLESHNYEISFLSRHAQDNYKTIVCDFENEKIPIHALDSIDTVFHLAGFAHDTNTGDKVFNRYQKINVEATIQLANLAKDKGVKRFVFVSSVKAGNDDNVDEYLSYNNVNEPEGIYGKTKREAELRLLELCRNSMMHIAIIRPALVYGPSVKGNLKMMFSGIKKGWFPPLPNTHNCRSMIHVDDLVKALVFVAETNGANGEIYIATDGLKYSTREIYETMCWIVGKPLPSWTVPKIFFVLISFLSSSINYKINKLLGNECYSSQKLRALGFKTELTFRNMNETSF